MPRITIFSLYYSPEPSGNAPYTTGAAEYLADRGWDVEVVAGYPHYPEWVKQPAARRSVVNGVTVTRSNHFVPSQPTTIGRGAVELSWVASGASTVFRKRRTDIVLGVSPTLSGAALATSASARSGVPCVLWFQDLMGQAAAQSGIGGADRVASTVRGAERAMARRADALILCADGYRPYFEDGGVDPSRTHVVRNWSTLPKASRTAEDVRTHLGLPTDAVVAVHSGNMGAKQGLDILLETAELSPKVTFVLQGGGSERSRLAEATDRRGLSNVVFLPSMDSQELADLLAAADVLLLTQRPEVTDMSLPSKLTSYLTAGTPVVASVNPRSETAALLDEAGLPSITDAGNAAALADAITGTTEKGRSRINPLSLFGSPAEIEGVLIDTLQHGAGHRPPLSRRSRSVGNPTGPMLRSASDPS